MPDIRLERHLTTVYTLGITDIVQTEPGKTIGAQLYMRARTIIYARARTTDVTPSLETFLSLGLHLAMCMKSIFFDFLMINVVFIDVYLNQYTMLGTSNIPYARFVFFSCGSLECQRI